MKIVVAGSLSHWNALEKHYIAYLQPKVEDIQLYPWPDLLGDYFISNLDRRIRYRFKLGVEGKIKKFNTLLFEHIRNVKPDILWVFKGVDIYPDTLSRIRDLGVKTVNYNPDHPLIRTFRSGGGSEIEKAIPYYDLFLCYSRDLMLELNRRFNGSVKTEYLPFGYDIPPDINAKLSTIHEETPRLCFIGNPDNELRFQILSEMIKAGIPIDIYGLGWHKYFRRRSKDSRIFPGVYNDEYWLKLREYRVQLNIFRPHNFNSHNMRSFEIPAVGGIQLAPDSIEHREFFDNGKEIFLYKNKDEIKDKAFMILGMSKDEVQKVRLAATLRCLKDGYSYKNRSEIVYGAFNKLLGGR